MGKSKRKRSRSRSRSRGRSSRNADLERRLNHLENLLWNHSSRAGPGDRQARSRSRSSPRGRSSPLSPSAHHRSRSSLNVLHKRGGSRSPQDLAVGEFIRSRSPSHSISGEQSGAEAVHANQSESPVLILSPDKDDLPASFLEAVGIEHSQETGNTHSISPGLTRAWTELLRYGVDKEEREKILRSYQPADSTGFKSPILNDEIAHILTAAVKHRDFRLMNGQRHLLSVLIAQACALKSLANLAGASSSEKEVIGTYLADSAKLTCSVYHSLTLARRESLYPFLSSTLKEITSKLPATNYLFGDNLAEAIQKQKSLDSISKAMKAAPQGSARNNASSSQQGSLNQRGPIRQQGGGRNQQGRTPSIRDRDK